MTNHITTTDAHRASTNDASCRAFDAVRFLVGSPSGVVHLP
ncbi:hypothetical protein [Aeromicrobium sp. Sec7.5]